MRPEHERKVKEEIKGLAKRVRKKQNLCEKGKLMHKMASVCRIAFLTTLNAEDEKYKRIGKKCYDAGSKFMRQHYNRINSGYQYDEEARKYLTPTEEWKRNKIDKLEGKVKSLVIRIRETNESFKKAEMMQKILTLRMKESDITGDEKYNRLCDNAHYAGCNFRKEASYGKGYRNHPGYLQPYLKNRGDYYDDED